MGGVNETSALTEPSSPPAIDSWTGGCRVILEGAPQSGARNMAIDEALLDLALSEGACALRLYRWSEATVSLGYFQKPEEMAADARLAGLPWVKRVTGGGAILHHHEWTYSVAVPAGHPLARAPLSLYERVHGEIVAWLRERGVPAILRGASPAPEGTIADSALSAEAAAAVESRRGEPFLCFGRGDPRDIVLGGLKILGSAQRRRRGAVLQHGSLLLRSSPYAPQFPGLIDLSGQIDLEREFPEVLIQRVLPLLEGGTRDGGLARPATNNVSY